MWHFRKERHFLKNKYRLVENPFFLLNASPADPDQSILSRALDLKLLTGQDTQDAQNQLMHPGGRLDAEIGYLPGISDQDVRKVREYLEAAEQEAGPAHLPRAVPSAVPESCLAAANAVSAFMEHWPVEDSVSAAALCVTIVHRMMDLSDGKVQEDLNKDRAAAGRPLVLLSEISGRLAERRRELLAQAAWQCACLPPEEHLRLEYVLADAYTSRRNPLYRSPVLDELVCKDVVQTETPVIAEVTEALRAAETEYLDFLEKEEKSQKHRQKQKISAILWKMQQIDRIVQLLDIWDRKTTPERRITYEKGYTADVASQLFLECNAFMVKVWNEYHMGLDGRTVFRKMTEVFTDLTSDSRELLEKNRKIILA